MLEPGFLGKLQLVVQLQQILVAGVRRGRDLPLHHRLAHARPSLSVCSGCAKDRIHTIRPGGRMQVNFGFDFGLLGLG